MRMSAVSFGFNGQTGTTHFTGKSRLRYCFTMENVTLSCGSALLQRVASQPRRLLRRDAVLDAALLGLLLDLLEGRDELWHIQRARMVGVDAVE